MRWVALIALALVFDFASDVYFRIEQHAVHGVDPRAWDFTMTALVIVGVYGLLRR